MTTTKINLEEFVDRKVKVTKKPQDNHDGEVFEGKVEAANNEKNVLLLKVKGKASAVLILGFEIATIETVTSSDDDVTQTTLKPVKLNNVRRHLVNAHGWKLSAVNQLIDEEAFVQHTGLHEGPDAADIGHKHEG